MILFIYMINRSNPTPELIRRKHSMTYRNMRLPLQYAVCVCVYIWGGFIHSRNMTEALNARSTPVRHEEPKQTQEKIMRRSASH